jgi:hypothetical protein
MTKEFIEILNKYNNRFTSSQNPMSFIGRISNKTMIDLMNKSLNENIQLVFEYNTFKNNIIPDNIFVKIGEKIVY